MESHPKPLVTNPLAKLYAAQSLKLMLQVMLKEVEEVAGVMVVVVVVG